MGFDLNRLAICTGIYDFIPKFKLAWFKSEYSENNQINVQPLIYSEEVTVIFNQMVIMCFTGFIKKKCSDAILYNKEKEDILAFFKNYLLSTICNIAACNASKGLSCSFTLHMIRHALNLNYLTWLKTKHQ